MLPTVPPTTSGRGNVVVPLGDAVRNCEVANVLAPNVGQCSCVGARSVASTGRSLCLRVRRVAATRRDLRSRCRFLKMMPQARDADSSNKRNSCLTIPTEMGTLRIACSGCRSWLDFDGRRDDGSHWLRDHRSPRRADHGEWLECGFYPRQRRNFRRSPEARECQYLVRGGFDGWHLGPSGIRRGDGGRRAAPVAHRRGNAPTQQGPTNHLLLRR